MIAPTPKWLIIIHAAQSRLSTRTPSAKKWSPTTLRDKLIKIGAKVVHHSRYVTFQLAEVAVPRRLYRAVLERIRRFAALSARAAPI